MILFWFAILSQIKVRPAIVVSAIHVSQDILIVPLTSKISSLFPGEFILTEWNKEGLNVPTAVKRGIYTVEKQLAIKTIGKLQKVDAEKLEKSLKNWLGL